MKYLIDENSGYLGRRIDVFLAEGSDLGLSRSRVRKLIDAGAVLLNGAKVKASAVLSKGDVVKCEVADESAVMTPDFEMEKCDFDILYECEDFLIVDKPAGVVVHPGENSHETGTLVQALADKIEGGDWGGVRPGIVHRLDKDTSGLMVVARNKKTHEEFIKIFKAREVEKKYVTLVKGVPKYPEGVIDSPIGRDSANRKKMAIVAPGSGKNAVSQYKVLESFALGSDIEVSLVEVEIKTGRTHQIRVHMAAIAHPVIGDSVYGIGSFNRMFKKKTALDRQFLHAFSLKFVDPVTGKSLYFESQLPAQLTNVIIQLKEGV